MDVMRNRIRPILDSLRQWRCRFSEELTEVEIPVRAIIIFQRSWMQIS